MKPLSFASIEADFFKSRNPLKKILSISLDLLGAKHSGLLYGTNETHMRFLPSSEWDRGVMDKFDGRGLTGKILKMVGTHIVTYRGLSPVYFYTAGPDGDRRETHGIIAYVLRHCADYYRKGINVVICPDTDRFIQESEGRGGYHTIPFFIYNGEKISKPKNHIKVDTRIVKHFKSSNSIYIILPDYGIMVINTADRGLLALDGDRFVREADLCQRLDMLIHLVERSSLAYLGRLKGQKGAELLWRKEEHLRRAYTHLSENEKKYRDLYENAPIAYFSLTPEGRIFQCNQKAVNLSGYPRKELVGMAASDLFEDQREAEKRFGMVWESLRKGEQVRDLEVHMVQQSGKPVWVSLSIEAIHGQDGRISEMRAMALDISRRKTLEKQLFHAQKMEAIGTLARGIAHDFNNVLSPVSGYAQMLLLDKGRDSQERERLQTIYDCTRHAKELVGQILTFSRQKEHQLAPIRIGDAVVESMSLVRSFLPSSIRIQTEISENCGYIMGDPVQLHQVIMNLTTNAFHAMEKDGSLTVSLDKETIPPKVAQTEEMKPGAYVCLRVSDSGPGIPPETLAKVFEPYFTTKEEGKGSGIGLSVVHGIVQGHGGEIRVSSEVGRGTSFKIYFPVCRRTPGDEAPDPLPAELNILTGTESILLVDDDTKVAFMHTRLLERLGYTVTCYTQSLDALEVYSKKPEAFDLVMTDYTMPDMDGYELAYEICTIRREQKVLLCTGLGDSIDTDKAPVGCIKGYISKPVDIQALSVLIRETLEKG